VPLKQPKKRRLWLNDGSCIRLRPEYKNHVWNYGFVEDRLRNGKKVRWLILIDEYTRECLASIPKRSWDHMKIIDLNMKKILSILHASEYLYEQCIDDILINYEDNAIKFMMETAISINIIEKIIMTLRNIIFGI